MTGEEWRRFLQEAGGVALADGAMGTRLFDAGLEYGDAPERWNLQFPERIRGIHQGYLAAGSRILLTNTFGGNRFRLAFHGLQDRVADVNGAAAVILRSAVAASGRPALVGGEIWAGGALPA